MGSNLSLVKNLAVCIKRLIDAFICCLGKIFEIKIRGGPHKSHQKANLALFWRFLVLLGQ